MDRTHVQRKRSEWRRADVADHRWKRLVVGLALSIVATTRGASAAEPDRPARPDILLVLADNWAWPHAGVCGDPVVQTPVFDRLAAEGLLFNQAYCTVPSCSASRAALLTGQVPHRLKEGANLWSLLPAEFAVYPDLLEAAGYHVGYGGNKGWGPGSVDESGRSRNPAGPRFDSFEEFLQSVPDGKPFCFWLGHRNPHRSYVPGSGRAAGLNPADVEVPPGLPDTPEVRDDILDYYAAVQKFDQDLGELLEQLDTGGRAGNTLVIVAGDNGWQFPRGLANMYDTGTRVPMAVRWPGQVKAGRRVDEFVCFTDFAPTFLEIAGLKPLPEMTGRSFLGLLKGEKESGRDRVYLERERHANVRRGDLSYPCRAVRTRDYLYVRNFRPHLWPVGDPELYKTVGPFGDCDPSPTKELILAGRDDPDLSKFFRLGFDKRPAEELYDLKSDPGQIHNVADHHEHAAVKQRLRADLDRWMIVTDDARVQGETDLWDRAPYFGRIRTPAAAGSPD